MLHFIQDILALIKSRIIGRRAARKTPLYRVTLQRRFLANRKTFRKLPETNDYIV